MIRFGCNRNRRGFSLIELLCVMGIIVVLMSLVLGPVCRVLKRAKAMQWGEEAPLQLQRTVDQLRSRFQGKIDFSPVTLRQLETNDWVNPAQLRFLKDRRVTFTSFSGLDPNDMVVILVRIDSGFLTPAGFISATKGRITKPAE